MITLDSVSKTYKVGTFGGKELHAVSNVSFDVQNGEVVSLIGESGSGKSTIGKMILRLISITSGKILFNGKDIASLKNHALKEYYRQVQGVFQDPFSSYNPIFKADRVFSIIHDEFYPDISSQDWKQKIEKSLTVVGLNPDIVLNKFPHQLSGGQLQRFLIARALLLNIQFLVADEIISMLDASTRIDVLNLLADLKSRGLSILFITHDLSLSYYISERAIILYRGCVVEMGATEKIFYQSLHPYTKMLMASVPRLDMKWRKRVEQQIDRSTQPGGCVYFDRCTAAEKSEHCAKHNPPLVQVDVDHYVACFGYKKED
ncbi:MAG: ABC transporter ATP-binding protein [Anaerolineales bacterium]|nr:ABC transporter ATP-binding protein [Anaerolineales bacterium]